MQYRDCPPPPHTTDGSMHKFENVQLCNLNLEIIGFGMFNYLKTFS